MVNVVKEIPALVLTDVAEKGNFRPDVLGYWDVKWSESGKETRFVKIWKCYGYEFSTMHKLFSFDLITSCLPRRWHEGWVPSTPWTSTRWKCSPPRSGPSFLRLLLPKVNCPFEQAFSRNWNFVNPFGLFVFRIIIGFHLNQFISVYTLVDCRLNYCRIVFAECFHENFDSLNFPSVPTFSFSF